MKLCNEKFASSEYPVILGSLYLFFLGLVGYYFYLVKQREWEKQEKDKIKEAKKVELDEKYKPRMGFFQAIDTEGN